MSFDVVKLKMPRDFVCTGAVKDSYLGQKQPVDSQNVTETTEKVECSEVAKPKRPAGRSKRLLSSFKN